MCRTVVSESVAQTYMQSGFRIPDQQLKRNSKEES